MDRPITEFSIPQAASKPPVPMRIDADLAAKIKEISSKCMMSDAAVLSRIVRDALPYVRLRERKLYEIDKPGTRE